MLSQKKRLKILLTKPFLVKEYIIKSKSACIIAKEARCTHPTIFAYLIKYNIKRRTISESNLIYSKILTKELLYKEYTTNKKSIYKISKITKINPGTIWNYLVKYHIPTRTLSDASILDDRTGKNNPMFGKFVSKKTRKKISNKLADFHHPNWQGGIGKLPYPFKFNNKLKESIRKQDNNQCQICGIKEKNHYRKLDIHHIDYNKQNLDPNNLISLCQICHMQTNYNREIYIEYFEILRRII